MPSVTVRHIPEEVHRRLRIRAAKNGRSMEAELRAVLAVVAGVPRSKAQPAVRRIREEPAEAAVEALPDAEPVELDASHAVPQDNTLSKVREFLKTRISEDAAA
jgi:plasmid stability protein